MSEIPVLIIGAGVVGLVLAQALKKVISDITSGNMNSSSCS
jgi:2-polyprenyl-6-methoxyphenol hydroxylase-like FAD-dependent oxidoreductase